MGYRVSGAINRRVVGTIRDHRIMSGAVDHRVVRTIGNLGFMTVGPPFEGELCEPWGAKGDLAVEAWMVLL
jgi:hypothetical protein